MKHAITLGEGNIRLSPKAYLNALRMAQNNPNAEFKQSFRDPTGWRGRGYTGREIVAEHFDMLHSRWASWNPAPGKGNRAAKRRLVIEAKNLECRWCGSKTGGPEFCDVSCRQSHWG
jgi:hypothetical protein